LSQIRSVDREWLVRRRMRSIRQQCSRLIGR
jgi:hypothetical protein